jgi:hypothetical protein
VRVVLHDERHAVQGTPHPARGELGIGLLSGRERAGPVQGDVGVEVTVGLGPREVRLRKLGAGDLPLPNQLRRVDDAQLGQVGRALHGAGTPRQGERERQDGKDANGHGRLLMLTRQQADHTAD